MPNYVRNIVKMAGIADLPIFSEVDGQKVFDFNKLIPMPSELQVEKGTKTEYCIIYYLTERCNIQIKDLSEENARQVNALVGNFFSSNWPEEVFRRVSEWLKDASEAECDEAYASGRQYISNYEKYGAPTWYEWRCQNWGTKWNACQTLLLDQDTLLFDTAWSNPAPIIQKLGEMYPAVEIEHWWADEDVGSNTGHRTLFDGREHVECFEQDKDAYAIYVKCRGENQCVYLDDSGVLRCRDCDDCSICNDTQEEENE